MITRYNLSQLCCDHSLEMPRQNCSNEGVITYIFVQKYNNLSLKCHQIHPSDEPINIPNQYCPFIWLAPHNMRGLLKVFNPILPSSKFFYFTNFFVKTGCGSGLLGLRALLCIGEPGKGSRRPLRFGELVNFAGPLSPFFF